MLILSNVNVGLSTCGSTSTPIYTVVVFSSFLILLGVIILFFWTQNLPNHIFFFHHSYFVSSCCSELYRKLEKFQPLSPKSALCFGCLSSVWDSIRPTSEGFPTSACRHTCATAASTLQSVADFTWCNDCGCCGVGISSNPGKSSLTTLCCDDCATT